MESGMEYICFT